MKEFEKSCYLLPWQEVSKILTVETEKHLGRKAQCRAKYEDESFWCTDQPVIPIYEACQIMHLSGFPAEKWQDTLPDEGGDMVDGFGMELCEHLFHRGLEFTWERRIIAPEGLWLVGVFDKNVPQPRPVRISGVEVSFDELKSKDELFNFFEEGSCTHAGLMEFCEDYKKRYDTDLCWPYPIAGDKHLGLFLVLVKGGVLCLPYDGFDGENYEFFNLEGAKLLTAGQIAELSRNWQVFSNGLVHAMTDMEVYLREHEEASK